jgi:Inosine-uridine nucleoside N-ribohydrolase
MFLFCPFFLHCFCTFFFQIPVYLGASQSLLATPPFEDFYGKDGLGDFVYPDPPNPADYLKREHAAVALARLASQYPSKFSLFLPRPRKEKKSSSSE